MSEEAKPLPCPWCGGDGCASYCDLWEKTEHVYCNDCGASGPETRFEKDAVAGWNAVAETVSGARRRRKSMEESKKNLGWRRESRIDAICRASDELHSTLVSERAERDALRERVAELETIHAQCVQRLGALPERDAALRTLVDWKVRECDEKRAQRDALRAAVERVRGLPRYTPYVRNEGEFHGKPVSSAQMAVGCGGDWLRADDVLEALGLEESDGE